MLPFDCGANSFEIYVKPGLHNQKLGNIDEYDVCLTADEFDALMKRMATKQNKHNYKYFQKEFKEYVYNEVTVDNYKNTETRVFKNQTIALECRKNTLVLANHKSKLTFLSVPSTTNVHEVSYVKRLTFRVNNRIFVNFEIKKEDKTGIETRLVYVNYNHESNVDAEGVTKSIEEVLKIIAY